MSNLRRQILKGVAVLLGGLALLGAATTAIANPIAVYLQATINWSLDFPYVPSTLSGYSYVSTDARGPIFLESYENIDPAAGPTDVSPSIHGYLEINPGETIFWSFAAFLSYGDFVYPVCAYGDIAIPGEPCDPRHNPPINPIATLMSDDFGAFAVTGAVFAFEGTGRDPVQIGTWAMWSHQHLIPEPSTLALLGIGVAGLGFTRRKRELIRANISPASAGLVVCGAHSGVAGSVRGGRQPHPHPTARDPSAANASALEPSQPAIFSRLGMPPA
jgi:hypothetical protein